MGNNPFTLKGKIILITGASSGIGRQIAYSCSEQGANVFLVARNKERLVGTYTGLKGKNHGYILKDIADYSQIDTIVQSCIKELGKISGFVHCAGIEETRPFNLYQTNLFEQMLSVNLFAGLEFSKIISKKNIYDSNGCSFVFISSIMGILGQPGKVTYCSSKAAILGAVKAMALELAEKRIRVNAISPALIETELSVRMKENIGEEAYSKITEAHPLGLGKPEDVANATIYLLSDGARWVTGSNLIVDGGYSAL